MIEVSEAKLDGVLVVKPFVFKDHRGEYVEIYDEKEYFEKGIKVKFVQDDISVSKKNVLRGIHGDTVTYKLISCLHGTLYFVVVNLDKKSKQYRQWQSFILSDVNRMQVLVPPKFGNAHLVMSMSAIFHYKQSTYYNPKTQFTCCWDDPDLDIWFPVRNPILSKRDGGV